MARFSHEDTTIYKDLAESHYWLIQHYPTSFPPQFNTTKVKEYATTMLEIYDTTIERQDLFTHGEHTILALPNYNPYINQTLNTRSQGHNLL